MARWHVELVGDRFDLEDLPDFLSSPDLGVIEEDGTYFLVSARLEQHTQGAEVHKEAQDLLPLVNAFATLRRATHKEIAIGSRVDELTAEGRKKHAVVLVGTIEARGKVNAVGVSLGGKPVPKPTPPESKWVSLALQDPDVMEALTLWGSHTHDWVNLYKIYEVIRSRADAVTEGWAVASEIDNFTHTANHPHASGDGSRHSRSKAQPPKKAMPLGTADDLIGRILRGWLEARS